MKKYTLHEAALAVCGLDFYPNLKDYEGAERAKMRKVQQDYSSAREKLERAVVAKILTARFYGYVGMSTRTLDEYRQASGKVGGGDVATQAIVDIPRDDLIAFMRSDDPNWQPPATLGGDPASAPRRKPVNYTDTMRRMDSANEHFWEKLGTKTPRTSAEIIEWLKEEGASDNEARAIDLIIRPNDVKKSGHLKPRGGTPKKA